MNEVTQFTEFPTEAAVIATLAQQGSHKLLNADKAPQLIAIAAGAGKTIVRSLELYEAHPRRAQAAVTLHSLDDLVAYLAGIITTDDHPVVFADVASQTFTAFPSYHQPGQPSWLDHVITVKRNLSRQLKIWKEKAGKRMNQEEFALFLDANLSDIHEPTGADVLSFAEKLEATRTETFKSAINVGTGEIKFTWNTDRNGDTETKLITDFTLRLPVFENGVLVELGAKIYHRIPEGKLTFWFDLRHLDHVLDTIWNEEVAALKAKLAEEDTLAGAVVYRGTPPGYPKALMPAPGTQGC